MFLFFKTKIHSLVVSIFIILLVIITVLFIKINHHFSNSMIRSFHQDQLYLVKTVATGMQQIIDQMSQEIIYLSNSNAIRQEEADAYRKPFQNFYRLFDGKVNSIYRIDQKGKVQYVYPFSEKEIGNNCY